MVRTFGVGPQMDTYVFALGIYVFGASWLSVSVAPAVIPSVSLLHEREGKAAANRALRAAARVILIYMGGAALLLCAVSPIVPLLAGRLGAGQVALATSSLRALAPILVLSAFAQTWELLLTATGAPVLSAAIPLIRPIPVALGLMLLPNARIEALPWLVLGGHALEAAAAGLILRARGWQVMPEWERSRSDLRAARRQYFAIATTGLLVSVSPLTDQLVVARMLRGGVAVLSYGQRLTTPLLIVAIALINSFFFPHALRHVAVRDSRGLLRMVNRLLLRAFMISALATAALIILADPLVRLAYLRKSFTETDVSAVAAVVRVYALYVPWAVVSSIVSRTMMAHNASHQLVIGAAVTPLINLGLDVVLARHMGLTGIALSSVIANVYVFTYTYAALRKLSMGSQSTGS